MSFPATNFHWQWIFLDFHMVFPFKTLEKQCFPFIFSHTQNIEEADPSGGAYVPLHGQARGAVWMTGDVSLKHIAPNQSFT